MKRWQAKWIGVAGDCLVDGRWAPVPAPEFRRCFIPVKRIEHPVVFITGLGYFEWTINNRTVTPDLLVPSPTQYDKRWRYMRYELDFPMEAGEKYMFSVKVGNGMYNSQTPDSPWHFDRATWRDYPKMILQLEDDGQVVFISDENWVVAYGPSLYDSFRGGEDYDARLENAFSMTEPEGITIQHCEAELIPPPVKHGEWRKAWVVAAPGGIGEEQIFPGCRIVAEHDMRQISADIWEAPFNVSGVPEIRVCGEAGAKIKLTCGEKLTPDGTRLDINDISMFAKDHFQEDSYILKGGGEEVWRPHFTYHGFQYVQTECTGKGEIAGMRQLVIHTAMERISSISTSNQDLELLDECAARSNASNFCGFPTDCPTREKNGWTSDALNMGATMFYTFDVAEAYAAYVDTIIDTQRPSGQISGIAPCSGWGYNWGSGGHWDLALFELPWLLYLHTGNADYLRRAYPAMKRNLEFQASVSTDGICNALGDWYAPIRAKTIPTGACPTASHIQAINIMLSIAAVLDDAAYSEELQTQRQYFVQKYNEHFYLGGGVYQGEYTTYEAMALNWGIVPDGDRALCLRRLHEKIVQKQYKVDFGMIGARQVPIALCENGFADDLYRMMTQSEYPGYQFMIQKRRNFTENWGADTQSLNHGFLSYAVACMYRYFAGFEHTPTHPGAKHLLIAPSVPKELNDFSAEYLGYRSGWRREKERLCFSVTVPEGAAATLRLPVQAAQELKGGVCSFEIEEKR